MPLAPLAEVLLEILEPTDGERVRLRMFFSVSSMASSSDLINSSALKESYFEIRLILIPPNGPDHPVTR